MTPDSCIVKWHVATGLPYLFVNIPQLISSCISVVLVLVFSTKFFRKGCYHSNAKLIVFCQMFFVSLFSVYIICTQISYLLNLLNNANIPCAFEFPAQHCLLLYYIHIFSISGMSFTQTCLSTERIISSLKAEKYENYGKSIGALLVSSALLLAAWVTWYSLSEFDHSEPRFACHGLPLSSRSRSFLLYTVIGVSDLIAIVLLFFTWKLNKVCINTEQYVLGRRYQSQENMKVVRLFVPVNIAHFIIFCGYASATALIRSFSEQIDYYIYAPLAMGAMILPYYTTLELTMLNLMIKNTEKERDEFNRRQIKQEQAKEAYFTELSKQWG